MFADLTTKLQTTFESIKSRGKLTDENIQEGIETVRKALLEADVNFKVVKEFVQNTREKALGSSLLKDVKAADHFIKIVSDEITEMLGEGDPEIPYNKNGPTIIMMCGLQGAGKTTTVGKLAKKLEQEGKKSLLVAADIQRPAAIDQLHILGEQVGVPVYSRKGATPQEVCSEAIQEGKDQKVDVIILDTAGRLHVDDNLMTELKEIQEQVMPHQIYLVIDSMIGQDAVNSAKEFNDRLELDGLILTKMDGDSRGGAALSVKYVIGKSIKFIGMGEKLDALENFYPDRLASRILGMGDIVGLVEKAEQAISEKDAKKMEEKILKNQFDFEDFLKQLQLLKKMGSLKDLIGMIPGIGSKLNNIDIDDKELISIESIIQSMTKRERKNPSLVENELSRRRRIAAGSGKDPQQVSSLLKQFKKMKKMMGGLGKMQSLMGGGDKGMDMNFGDMMSGDGMSERDFQMARSLSKGKPVPDKKAVAKKRKDEKKRKKENRKKKKK